MDNDELMNRRQFFKKAAKGLLFIGTTEVVLIAAIALLLFDGKKVPELMRGLGKGVSEFKRGTKEVTEPFGEAKKELDDAVGKV